MTIAMMLWLLWIRVLQVLVQMLALQPLLLALELEQMLALQLPLEAGLILPALK